MSTRLEFRPGAVIGSSSGAQGIKGGQQPPVKLNPITYPEWDTLIAGCGQSTVFHTSAWARVLQESYRHEPVYVCSLAEGQLRAVLPLMEVSTRLTGRRGVSLPFTDLCAPLIAGNGDAFELYPYAIELGRAREWRSLEFRHGDYQKLGALPSLAFYGHAVELVSDKAVLFEQLNSAFKRGIRKAEAAGLKVEFTDTLDSMRTFYRLHCQTRRGHGLPPQPLRFFESIARHLLGSGKGTLATVWLGEKAVASAVLLHHGRHAIYKFGASDEASRHLRPNNLLMWELIQWAAHRGFTKLDLGRTSLRNAGLRRFKLGLGAREEKVEYFKYDFGKKTFVSDVDRSQTWVNHVFRRLPLPVLRLAGRVIYPHLA